MVAINPALLSATYFWSPLLYKKRDINLPLSFRSFIFPAVNITNSGPHFYNDVVVISLVDSVLLEKSKYNYKSIINQ